MNPETRFLALVTALLMLWAVSSGIRESTASSTAEAVVIMTEAGQLSDERLKEDVRSLPYGLSQLLGLRPVSYRYKNFPSQPRIGFIAQEVQAILPEVVYLSPEDRESVAPSYYGINYGELVPLLVRSIQQQQEAITSLSARVEMLEAAMTQYQSY